MEANPAQNIDTQTQPEAPATPPLTPEPKSKLLKWIMVAVIAFVLITIAIFVFALFLATTDPLHRFKKTTTNTSTQSPTHTPNPASNAANATANWKTYANTEGEYSIKYPSDFVLHVNEAHVFETNTYKPTANYIELDSDKAGVIPYITVSFSASNGGTFQNFINQQVTPGSTYRNLQDPRNIIIADNVPSAAGTKTVAFSEYNNKFYEITIENTADKTFPKTFLSTFEFIYPANGAAGWKTYTNTKYGFQLTIPAKGKLSSALGFDNGFGDCGNHILEKQRSSDDGSLYTKLSIDHFLIMEIRPWEGSIRDYLVQNGVENSFELISILGSNADEAIKLGNVKADPSRPAEEFEPPLWDIFSIYKKDNSLFILTRILNGPGGCDSINVDLDRIWDSFKFTR